MRSNQLPSHRMLTLKSEEIEQLNANRWLMKSKLCRVIEGRRVIEGLLTNIGIFIHRWALKLTHGLPSISRGTVKCTQAAICLSSGLHKGDVAPVIAGCLVHLAPVGCRISWPIFHALPWRTAHPKTAPFCVTYSILCEVFNFVWSYSRRERRTKNG